MPPITLTGTHAPDPGWLAEWLDTLRAAAQFHSIDHHGHTLRRIILTAPALGQLSDAAAQLRAFVQLQQQVAQLEADLDHERAARRQAQGDLAQLKVERAELQERLAEAQFADVVLGFREGDHGEPTPAPRMEPNRWVDRTDGTHWPMPRQLSLDLMVDLFNRTLGKPYPPEPLVDELLSGCVDDYALESPDQIPAGGMRQFCEPEQITVDREGGAA